MTKQSNKKTLSAGRKSPGPRQRRRAKASPAAACKLIKFVSAAGPYSRRQAMELIKAGQVSVNHHKVSEPSALVHPTADVVRLKGKVLKAHGTKIYLAFHKPQGVVSSMRDPQNRPCLSHFFKSTKAGMGKVFPVGRLDFHSTGLMILTNDGDLALKLSHPRYQIAKTYLVKLNQSLTLKHIQRLKKGVWTPVGTLKALAVGRVKNLRKIKGATSQGTSKNRPGKWFKIIISEGKNRQLHRMFESLNIRIKTLKRTAIGKLKLGSLKSGQALILTPKEKNKVFLPPPEI